MVNDEDDEITEKDNEDGEPCINCGKPILEHLGQMLHCPGQFRYSYTSSN